MDQYLKYQVLRTAEFNEWFVHQNKTVQCFVLARLHRIAVDGLIELKWKSGLRVYTARIGQMVIVVLAGGNKNGQSKDVSKAKKSLTKIKNSFIDGA